MRIQRNPGSLSAAAAPFRPAIAMELLDQGAHVDPRHGSNVLELASVLAGDRWSAKPESVHPALAVTADAVNDLLTDDRRRLLVPFAPWLLGTNSADPRIWPAVASACMRAATPSVPEPGLSWLLADLDRAHAWIADIDSPRRRHRDLARRRDRRWAMRASCSALAQVAASASPEDADSALCQALVDCINECRRLAGKEAVDPRLPLADCPQRLLVQLHAMWSPGCDWMETGYKLASTPQPACLLTAPAGRMPDQHPAATTSPPLPGSARGERCAD